MDGSLDWNGVRDFVAIVEAGSLTRAATGLRVSQATLSRRLAAFERQVGVQLLIRGPRHLELTEAGQRILETARRMSRDAAEIPDEARDAGGALSGLVRVSSTEAFSGLWLAEQLHGFCSLYPGICVELIADNRLTDLLGRDAEIAVRLVQPTQQDAIARRVGTLRIGFYATDQYVERNGNPKRREDLGADLGADLTSHQVVAISGRRQFAADIEARVGTENTVLRVRNTQDALTAIRTGMGIGPVYSYLGDADGGLVRVLTEESEIELPIWLVALPEMKETARVRVLYDYLAAEFLKQRDAFS